MRGRFTDEEKEAERKEGTMSDLRPETVHTLHPSYVEAEYQAAVETWMDSSAAARFLDSLPSIAQDPNAYIAQAEQANKTSLGTLDLDFQRAMERGSVAYSVARAALAAAEQRRGVPV